MQDVLYQMFGNGVKHDLSCFIYYSLRINVNVSIPHFIFYSFSYFFNNNFISNNTRETILNNTSTCNTITKQCTIWTTNINSTNSVYIILL